MGHEEKKENVCETSLISLPLLFHVGYIFSFRDANIFVKKMNT